MCYLLPFNEALQQARDVREVTFSLQINEIIASVLAVFH